MKTISISAYNRPAYLKQTLDSLHRNNLSGYHIFFTLEPGNKAVESLCKGFRHENKDILINKTRLGVEKNINLSIQRAFLSGSDFNVHIEDDVVLSGDAMDLANWFLGLNTRDKYLALGFFNFHSTKERNNIVIPHDGITSGIKNAPFYTLGWACSKFQWDTYISPRWFGQNSWDYNMASAFLPPHNLRQLIPAISRSKHIGKIGVHCNARKFKEKFEKTLMSSKMETSFTLVE